MSKTVQFWPPPKKKRRQRRKHLWPLPDKLVKFLLVMGAVVVMGAVSHYKNKEPDILCFQPKTLDGDTLDCGGKRIRLLGIDAPELPGHCRAGRQCTPGNPYAAHQFLSSHTRTRVVCAPQGKDYYGRTLARCKADGEDLSCAMLKSGHAVRRYGFIFCWP